MIVISVLPSHYLSFLPLKIPELNQRKFRKLNFMFGHLAINCNIELQETSENACKSQAIRSQIFNSSFSVPEAGKDILYCSIYIGCLRVI